MTRKASRKKRSKKDGLFDPADILQLRMDHYGKLARDEIAKGEDGIREHIDDYLRLAQDAAKELGPYRHARAQAGADGEQNQTARVVRLPSSHPFKDIDDWLFWCMVAEEKLQGEDKKTGLREASERLLERFIVNGNRPLTAGELDEEMNDKPKVTH